MTNEICPHCQLPRQGAHSCMDSMQGEIAQLRGNLSLAEEGLANYALEVERLRAALRGLTDMYCRTWDRVDGALMMMPDNIERFEKAHAAARTALGEALDGDAHEPGVQLPVIENWAAFARESKDPAVRNMYADFKAVLEGASRDASPADLVGALQDVVHTDLGPVRPGHAVKSDAAPSCASEMATVTRVVGDELIYCQSGAGAFVLTPDKIKGYCGESLADIGIRVGAKLQIFTEPASGGLVKAISRAELRTSE